MSEPRELSNVTLEAEHVPDYVHAPLNNPGEGGQDLPGEVRLYVVIDGARLLLDTFKASTVFEAQERAQAEQDEQADEGNAAQAGPQHVAGTPTPPGWQAPGSSPPSQTPAP